MTRAEHSIDQGGHAGDPALDDTERRRLLDRLRRIEGQVRGLQRMVEEGRYCPDILAQVAAVQASLRGAAGVLLQGHLRHCVTDAMRSRDPVRAEATYAELIDLFGKFGR
jgi:DNA-binding FrmR family transcriptional regulator